MAAQPEAPWRIILFSDNPLATAFFAQFLPAQGHRLVALVTSAKRNPAYLDVVGAVPVGTDVLLSEHPRRWGEMLRPLRPDLIICNVFPLRLPQEVLDLPRLGAVNIHGGLLPHQRGTDGPMWFIRNGERETGWTMHRMAAALDTGPTLAQVAFPIGEEDDVNAIFGGYARTAPEIVLAGLARIARGDVGEPQDESQARYYGRIADEAAWKAIDWAQPAETIHRIVRSSTFARDLPPGAVGTIDGVPHRITRTRLLPGAAADGPLGSVVGRQGELLLVQCGDGPIGVVDAAPVAVPAGH